MSLAVPTDAAAADADSAPPAEIGARFGAGYNRYALWLLMLVYVVNFIDRTIIYMLIEPIKRDLGLLDWQLGLLSGLAFGLVYMALSFPLAVLSDRHHRPTIIAACLLVWSAFTAVCGLAANFIQLALARAGVGVGEAGCVPAAHALIADSTPRARRASALAFFAVGAPLGQMIGFIMAGYIADRYGWRHAFIVAAAPGFLLAALCFFTLREPRARALPRGAGDGSVSLGQTLRYVRGKPAFWRLGLGAAVRVFISYGHGPFLASFFYRAHGPEVERYGAAFGMQPQTFMGFALALMLGVVGVAGIWVGGRIADRWGARDITQHARVPAWSSLALVPVMALSFWVDNLALALALVGLGQFLQAFWAGPVYAAAQSMVPPAMRAKSSAIMIFILNFGGLTFGALVVGGISDLVASGLGLGEAEGIRWALLVTTLASIVSAPLFWSARRTIARDIES